MKETKNVLVIEDNIAQGIYAQTALAKNGYRQFSVATNLAQALELIPQADYILSDLFFPAGSTDIQIHSSRFISLYEKRAQERYPVTDGAILVRKAIGAWAELFDKATLEEGLEMFEQHTNNYDAEGKPNSVLRAARDAVRGRTDIDKYEVFMEKVTAMKEGNHDLPLGIIATEYATQLRKPAVIVTSTYHHDDLFEAVATQLKVPYVDTMVRESKDWDAGISRLESLIDAQREKK